ncbi:MAG: FAD:protein FMN transferase [Marinobacter sp.]|nr:FAD:protein FMN transferase [Marinobacter sp.]
MSRFLRITGQGYQPITLGTKPVRSENDQQAVLQTWEPSASMTYDLEWTPDRSLLRARFYAMGSPMEILLDQPRPLKQEHLAYLLQDAVDEIERIEAKYSRYRPDSLLSQLNQGAGTPCQLDQETARLMDFADLCFQLSDGLFDITSGVLRAYWRFGSDGHSIIPAADDLNALRSKIGWQKVSWQAPWLTLQTGMELDLGGICKEYAADRLHDMLATRLDTPFLINLGGDIRCNQPRQGQQPWVLGIEHPVNLKQAIQVLSLDYGGLATSGDTRRYYEHQGKRYGHILDPRSGYPVEGAPRSITVAAGTCTEAGILSTLAMLQGPDAEAFLQAQGVTFWVYR